MEAESVHMENMQELSQAVQGKSFLDDFRVQKDEPNINLSRKLLVHGSETGGKTSIHFLSWHTLSVEFCRRKLTCIYVPIINLGLMATTYGDTGAEMTPTKGFNPESLRDSNMSSAAGDNNDVSVNCSRNVIDLIGAFDNHPPHNYKIASSNVTGKFDCDPQLDLSLRRSRSSSLENGEKKQKLGHSNSSAFTR